MPPASRIRLNPSSETGLSTYRRRSRSLATARQASTRAAQRCAGQTTRGLSSGASAARRFATSSEQRPATRRAVAFPTGTTVGSVTSRASAIVTFSPQTHRACGPRSCASEGGELRSTMPDKHIRGQVSAHAGQQARTTGTSVSAAPAQRRAANRLTAGLGSQEQCRPARSVFTRPFGNEFGASRRRLSIRGSAQRVFCWS
jgi:hypothetical protein